MGAEPAQSPGAPRHRGACALTTTEFTYRRLNDLGRAMADPPTPRRETRKMARLVEYASAAVRRLSRIDRYDEGAPTRTPFRRQIMSAALLRASAVTWASLLSLLTGQERT